MVKYLTREGLEQLKKELERLKTTERKALAKRLEEAISFGDLSENAAYHEAKDAQGFLEGRIAELEETVQNAVVVSDNKRKKDTVQVGCQVEVNSKFGKQKFQIVGEEESNPMQGKISYKSPIGKALLGHKKGDQFLIDTPQGKVEYKVLKIE